MKPSVMFLYYYARLFGLAPYTVHVKNGRNLTRVAKIGVIDYLRMILLSVVMFACYTHTMQRETRHGVTLFKSIEIFTNLTTVFMPIFSIGLIMYNRLELVDALSKMDEVEITLRQFGRKVDYRVVKLLLRLQVTIIIISCVYDSTMIWLADPNIGDYIIHVIGSHLPYSLMLVIISQFTEWVLIVRQQFMAVNHVIDKWADETDYSQKKIQTIQVGEGKQIFIRVMALRAVRKLHYKLCDVARIINTVYTWQIFVCVTKLFNYNIHQLYAAYKWTGYSALAWILLNALDLMLITISCTVCEMQSERSAQILHKVNRQPEDELNDAIELFSLQMLHQRVSFTAYGFFPLDCSLLFSIVAATTTYIVILIQFDSSSLQEPTE